ncbi:HD domain-containing phosphohydrolase [Magnetospirillum sulfuroxidans]|uniref:HD domain-containing protein n=1 Tax=Magnetospirillum sulfuroxidans TaxID=611300 RepID=A0ABS5IFG3_9PROT|nr:HD domain-containing phosphohydrolase [Magnetospirillum sulfuroxidans]MBR9972503.1 HD domain-containing protein [Magnetospirillum sulfuroxidans]
MTPPPSLSRLSLRSLLAGSLTALCVFLAAATGYILYELNLRKHDYQILNLAGQMRVLASSLPHQAGEFLRDDLLPSTSGDQTARLFERSVSEDMELYQRIIEGFVERELPADLIGQAEALRCNWDQRSTNQLDRSAAQWRSYRQGLDLARGADATRPQIFAMAAYMVANGSVLVHSTEELAHAFQAMMEGKLRVIRLLIVGMLTGALAVAALILGVMHRSILRPLARTITGFDRVASGDLGFQVENAGTRELASMTAAFNNLSSRLRSVFDLIEHIGRGSNMAETMTFVGTEFRRFVPVDGLALLVTTPDGLSFVAESSNGIAGGWPEMADPILSRATRERMPLSVDSASAETGVLADFLRRNGIASLLVLPLLSVREGGAALVVASARPSAYSQEHQRFLGGIATQLDAILARTMVMDGLVVAAVQGLAKLAESRDPETGDHLIRMSLYCTFIADELRGVKSYGGTIDRDYIRALHRFAPMHDIGKVGIADRVLLKPGRLDDEERHEMNRHPGIGADVLKLCEQRMNELGHSIFRIGIEIAQSHHEKWDGSGYPDGLRGAEIPLSARIVAVADVFDALTSKRPYKEAWSTDKALEIIRADAGRHFDPDVVEALDRCLPQVLEVYDRMKHV